MKEGKGEGRRLPLFCFMSRQKKHIEALSKLIEQIKHRKQRGEDWLLLTDLTEWEEILGEYLAKLARAKGRGKDRHPRRWSADAKRRGGLKQIKLTEEEKAYLRSQGVKI